MSQPPRRRTVYATLLLFTIVAGLASRRFPDWQPDVIARYAGDTLWAAMVFWLLVLLTPAARTRWLAASALGIAIAVEVSQLYHAPWLDGLRATRVGALVLGQGFLWSDLASYAVGVVLAAALDAAICRPTTAKRDAPATTSPGTAPKTRAPRHP